MKTVSKKFLSLLLAALMMASMIVMLPAVSAESYNPLGGWAKSGHGPITVKHADPSNVVKDGEIGEGEYEKLDIDLTEDNTPLNIMYKSNENMEQGLAMLETMEYYFSWDEVHGFNFAIRNKPEKLFQELDVSDGEYPEDHFARNLAYVLNATTENGLAGSTTDRYCIFYALAKRTDTGAYLEGHYDENQLGMSASYDPEADVDYIITYSDDGYSMIEWSVPFSEFSTEEIGAGSKLYASITAMAGGTKHTEIEFTDSYGIGIGDYCYMIDAKVEKTGSQAEFDLSAETLSGGSSFKYELNEASSEATITGYKGAGGDVEIPAEIDGYPVTGIVYRAFYNCSSLTSVSIPDSVKAIGPNAFSGCSALKTVEVGSGVETIGEWAFSGCTALGSIALPDSVTSIGRNAFVACSSLKSVTIPSGLTEIADRLFYNCTSLASIALPDSVAKIGNSAFSHCEALTEISIPKGVTSIVYSSFKGCSSLKNVTIPSSVTTILDDAFSGCSSIKKVSFVGTEAQWKDVTVKKGNDDLLNATIEFHTHSFGKWTVKTAPTCTKKGVEVRTCACGETETRSVKALGHDFGKDGNAEKCARCGAANPNYSAVSFTDVPADAYFAAPVNWAVANNITQGIGGGKFGPDNGCTRGQVVTFLWRAAGSPEPKSSKNPFTDVASGDYFYSAVLWAVEKGVTAGTSATTFSPNATCTRGQIVTFQYRANGSPEPKSTSNPFTDVSSGDYFFKAVLWAVENNITKGTSATAFSPNATCTRAQVVTFLYRDMAD